MVKKRELSLCAIIVAICFVVSQSLSVYAVTNSTLTSQQLGTIFDGVESIVVQLEGIGLSEADISELFQLTPRENGFYAQTSTQTIPYTGTFVADEYSCAVTPQIRQAGNRLSGFAETTYASLLA